MQFLTQKHDEVVQIEDDPALSKLRQQIQYVNFFKNTQSNKGLNKFIFDFLFVPNYFYSTICYTNN